MDNIDSFFDDLDKPGDLVCFWQESQEPKPHEKAFGVHADTTYILVHVFFAYPF